MTITLTAKEQAELWAEAVQTNGRILSQEPHELLCEVPRQLGKGYVRYIEVYPQLRLMIQDCEYHDMQFKVPEWDHPVQFTVLLSGIVTDSFGQIGGGHTLISGSGVQRKMVTQVYKFQRYVEINIHLPADVLRTLFPAQDGALDPELRFLNKENDWQTLIYPKTTPAIQGVAWEIVNCSMQGISKRVFLLGKVMELIALQLAPVLNERGVAKQPPKLKSTTIAQIHYARDILLTKLENPPSQMELAQQVGVSDRTLRKGFRELFGTTVFGYLTEQRMVQAEHQLREGTMTVAEIANQMGYVNPSHFAAAFKRKFGINPSDCLLGKKIIS